MKQIELKKLKNDEGLTVDYRDMILSICRQHPHGITVDEMEKAIRVIGRVKAANGVLRLEDADHATLLAYVMAYPFTVADETLIQFRDDMKNAETVEA